MLIDRNNLTISYTGCKNYWNYTRPQLDAVIDQWHLTLIDFPDNHFHSLRMEMIEWLSTTRGRWILVPKASNEDTSALYIEKLSKSVEFKLRWL